MDSQLLRFAETAFVLPPFMIEHTTPPKSRLETPSLLEVLRYAKVKEGSKLSLVCKDSKRSVVVASLSDTNFVLK